MWTQVSILLLLCANAHQRTSSKEALLNNTELPGQMMCASLPLATPVLTHEDDWEALVTIMEADKRVPTRAQQKGVLLIKPNLSASDECPVCQQQVNYWLPIENHPSRRRTR